MASGSATELFMEVGANAHRFSPYLRGFAISQRGNTEETEALGREWSEFVGINKGFALSASGSWDKSDAGVAGLEESLLEENKRFMAFYGYSADFSDGSNGVRHGDPAEFGVALKTEFAPASAYASQQTFDLTGTGTGALYDARVVYPYQITVPPFSNGDFNIAAWASGSYSLAVYSRQATQAFTLALAADRVGSPKFRHNVDEFQRQANTHSRFRSSHHPRHAAYQHPSHIGRQRFAMARRGSGL